jgi:hypothetical protein
MKLSDFSRYALGFCAAAAMLGSCGGSQPPIGAPLAMSQGPAIATHAAHSTSWMLRGSLLYVVTDTNLAYVVEYPSGKLAQKLLFDANVGTGACSDSGGNVFITAGGAGTLTGVIYEFAHGGKTAIAMLDDANYVPSACSVDPTSENLTVTNFPTNGNCVPGGNVAVYAGGHSPPTSYTDSNFYCYSAAAYDDQGNLFIGGEGYGSGYLFVIAELPRGSSTFTDIALNEPLTCRPECDNHMQWDGTYLAITRPSQDHKSPIVYRVQVSGSTGTIVGTTKFKGDFGKYSGEGSWIDEASTILDYRFGSVAIWKYPAGGKIVQVLIKGLGGFRKPGLTISQ